MRKVALCLVLTLVCALFATAQVSTSSVIGVVTDSSGAVVPNATVEVKNEATGQTYTATTSDAGKYTIPSVIPGAYSVTITAKGFQKYASIHNALTVGQPLVVNAAMTVGAANETVEVQSNYERIETTNATISDVITEKQVKNLPLNGRNPLTLLTLEPGVVQRPSGSSGSGTHVFGSRDRSHNVTIDGIDANESTVPNPQSNIQRLNPDNVQEFRTVTLGATAETGRNSGANVMIATKPGSNGIHGDVYEFLRNNALNSNEWYNTAQKIPVPKLNMNQFGFDVGGPLIKNKTFWFGSFQDNIIKESAPIASFFGIPTTYSPTLRSGVFRYVKGTVVANGVSLTKNDPRLVDAAGNLVAGVVPCASASSTNCIASYNINATNDPLGIGPDPKMVALANSLPTPNFYNGAAGDGLNYAGYNWNPPTKFTGPNYLIRIDHTFGPNDNIFGHWLQNHFNTTEGDFTNARPEVYPGFAPLGEALRLGRNLAVSYRHMFTPNLVNEFTMGFNRFAFAFTFGESNPAFGDLTKNPPYADDCVYGSTTLMTPPGCVSPKTQRAVTVPQFVDNVSWTHGAHTFHAGVNIRLYYHNDARGFFGSTITYPGILFSRSSRLANFCNGACTGSNVISATNLSINSTDLNNLNQAIVELAGVPSSLRKSFVADFINNKYASTPYATVYTRAHQYDSYIQDEWKVRQNVTVNAGLRWEYNPAPFDAKESLVPDKPIDGSQGPVTFVKSDRWFKNNNLGSVGPRLGIAWSPNDKTSIRVGYSWLFDTISTFQVTAMAGKVPGFMLGCTNNISSAGTVTTAAGCVAPTGLGNRLSNFPQDVPAPSSTPSAALLQPVQPRTTAPSVGAFDPNLKNPSVHEWNLSIQRELPLHIVGEVGYVGKRGTHLYRGYDANQIDPLAHAGLLDSFNIAHANVLAGCNPDGTKPSSGSLCPTGGATPTMLLGLVTNGFLNSSSSISDFTINNIGNLANRMDALALNDPQRKAAAFPLTYFRPNPQFTQIFYQDSGGDSYYHGLIVSARRRFEQGLTFNLSYTFSKSIDDLSIDPTGASTSGGLSTTGSTTPTDIRNFRLDRAVSDFDNKHVLVGSMYYELPIGRGKKFGDSTPGWLNQVIGGWSLTQIVNYQSGEPFTVYSGSFTTNSQHNSTAVLVGDKPGSSITYNVPGVLGPVLYNTGGFISAASGVAPGTVTDLNCQVFKNGKTKFCIPAAGQQGERRNSFRGPNFWNIDGGLMKNFKMTERFNLQFRAEIFNMLNHPNFENPRNASVGSPNIQSTNFGTVCCTTAAVQSSSQVNPIGEPSRVIQLGLKLSF